MLSRRAIVTRKPKHSPTTADRNSSQNTQLSMVNFPLDVESPRHGRIQSATFNEDSFYYFKPLTNAEWQSSQVALTLSLREHIEHNQLLSCVLHQFFPCLLCTKRQLAWVILAWALSRLIFDVKTSTQFSEAFKIHIWNEN